MTGGSLLVVPALEKGRGGGHLSRSLNLVLSLPGEGREAFLYIPPGERAEAGKRISALVPAFPPSRILSSLSGESFSFIILDRFKTPAAEFRAWSKMAPLIGLDEGGPRRASFEFLLDLLPGLPPAEGPNLSDPTLLPLPQNRGPGFFTGPAKKAEGASGGPLRVLVSFGAEDKAGLREAALRALEGLRREGRVELHAPGPFPMLRECLADYDLLITHFGLTAFEALHAGTPVVLLSPGAYHEKLARRGGFISAGIGPQAAARLPRHIFREDLREVCGAAARRYGLDKPPPETLGGFLAKALPLGGRSCPGCGRPLEPAEGLRFRHRGERSYRRCASCGLVSMIRYRPVPIEYGGDYFFGFYKKQYGKTYLEDFPHLAALGTGRLGRIKALLRVPAGRRGGTGAPEKRRLLDIGCAYGPFLKAARDEGFSPLGIEPAEDARRYVEETLGIPCLPGFFPGPLGEEEGVFDVISLWFVIEHFENPGQVLGTIHRLLKPGGVLAFSTPSFSGVSGRKSLGAFLEKSPPDHWTVWSPGMAAGLLRRRGFRVKKIVVSGHHPERFPLPGFLTRPGGALRGMLLLLSRLFRLGDTFEVYGVKNP